MVYMGNSNKIGIIVKFRIVSKKNIIFANTNKILTNSHNHNIISLLFRLQVRGGAMSICYDKLWKLLIDKHITKTEMRKRAGISTSVLAKMGKNETVSMDTLIKISITLQCGLDDIVEITADEQKGSTTL